MTDTPLRSVAFAHVVRSAEEGNVIVRSCACKASPFCKRGGSAVGGGEDFIQLISYHLFSRGA